MLQLKNDRLIKALQHQPVDRTPIWIMRQAGRYLPEYRAAREQAGSFMRLCKTPELACEVTLQPLQRFPLDAAIIFSDILTIPDAMGLGLHFIENKGPVLEQAIRNETDIKRLGLVDLEQLAYVYDAIRLAKHEIAGQVPLIGFCGSPWTLAAYMVEGQSVQGFPTLQTMLRDAPFLLHQLLDKLAQSVSAHLNAQIKAGVSVVMIFDTWGGMLEGENYATFSLDYIRQVLANVLRYHHSNIPRILFTKQGAPFLEKMAEVDCDCLGIDWGISLQEARQRVGHKVALQGNMHPQSLLQSPADIEKEVAQLLASYGHGTGHVFNLGHGITPDVPPDHVKVLVEAVHELSKSYHMKGE